MAATALRQALETLVMETDPRRPAPAPKPRPTPRRSDRRDWRWPGTTTATVAMALASAARKAGSQLRLHFGTNRGLLVTTEAGSLGRHGAVRAMSRSGRARRASSVEKLPRPLDDDPRVIVGEVEKIVVAGDDDVHLCRQRERDEVVVIRVAAHGLRSRLRVAPHVGDVGQAVDEISCFGRSPRPQPGWVGRPDG